MSPLPWAECPAMNDTSVPEINRLECQVKTTKFYDLITIQLVPSALKYTHVFHPPPTPLLFDSKKN